MRRFAHQPAPQALPEPAGKARSDRDTLARLWPYLWAYRVRVVLALAFMVGAKVANVGVPLLLKTLIDRLAPNAHSPAALLAVPAGLLLGYGLLRLSTSSCANWCLPRPPRGRRAASRCRCLRTCMR